MPAAASPLKSGVLVEPPSSSPTLTCSAQCRYSQRTSLVLVTHGLALRVFLMRWFHWSVDQFMQVFNPPNAEVHPHWRSAAPICHDLCTPSSPGWPHGRTRGKYRQRLSRRQRVGPCARGARALHAVHRSHRRGQQRQPRCQASHCALLRVPGMADPCVPRSRWCWSASRRRRRAGRAGRLPGCTPRRCTACPPSRACCSRRGALLCAGPACSQLPPPPAGGSSAKPCWGTRCGGRARPAREALTGRPGCRAAPTRCA